MRALGAVRLVAARVLADEALVLYNQARDERHQVFPHARLVPEAPEAGGVTGGDGDGDGGDNGSNGGVGTAAGSTGGLRSVYLGSGKDGGAPVHYVPPLLRQHGVRVELPPKQSGASSHFVTAHDCKVYTNIFKAIKSVTEHRYNQVSAAYARVVHANKKDAGAKEVRDHLRKMFAALHRRAKGTVAAARADVAERAAELAQARARQADLADEQSARQRAARINAMPRAAIV